MTVLGETDRVLICREDHVPLYVKEVISAGKEAPNYQLFDESKSSWLKQEDAVGVEKLRPRIEPWLLLYSCLSIYPCLLDLV